MRARIVVIDNYDSFVYNLVQYLGELDAEPIVVRNDEVEPLAELERTRRPDGVLVSPGPGRPRGRRYLDATAIRYFGERLVPVLGVCLGHQCIGQLYGADRSRWPRRSCTRQGPRSSTTIGSGVLDSASPIRSRRPDGITQAGSCRPHSFPEVSWSRRPGPRTA